MAKKETYLILRETNSGLIVVSKTPKRNTKTKTYVEAGHVTREGDEIRIESNSHPTNYLNCLEQGLLAFQLAEETGGSIDFRRMMERDIASGAYKPPQGY